jgi:hypothetical protein
MEQYDSQLSGRRLAQALGATDRSLLLATIPTDLQHGAYRLRIDAEILRGSYAGGMVLSDLERGLEGTTAAAHRAGVIVRHVVTGESIQKILAARTQDGRVSLEGVRTLVVPDGALVVDGTTATLRHPLDCGVQPAPRPAAARLYLFNTFS